MAPMASAAAASPADDEIPDSSIAGRLALTPS